MSIPVCQKKCDYLKSIEKRLKELEIENEKLKRDNLTNVWNRHYLDELLEKEYYPKIEKGWHYNVYMIDINDLHYYNRKYGYVEGDKYIKDIIDNIKKEMEKQKVSGSIFRTGGDEFLIFIQPYDNLELNNIKNITYAKDTFKFGDKLRDVIKRLDKKIIKDKNAKRRN